MRIVLSFLAAIAFVPFAYGQQQPPAQSQPPNRPIELPEFLVTGKELIEVAAGAKQSPSRPPLLTAARLDSLNPIEKQPLPGLPAKPLPQYTSPFTMYPGYVVADMGLYVTPRVSAGYSATTGGYRIDADVLGESSTGWIDNSGYTVLGANVMSTFVAPDKYLVFGGSTTEALLGISNRSYRLFSGSDALERSHANLRAGIDVSGAYHDVSYSATGSFERNSLSTEKIGMVADNAILGRIKLEQQWTDVRAGAQADIQLRTFAGNAYPFVDAGLTGRWNTPVARLSAAGGLQWSTSTLGVDRFGLRLHALADIDLGAIASVRAEISSGMRPTAFADIIRVNPYVDEGTQLDAVYDILNATASVLYHPTVRVQASAGLTIRKSDREPVWQGTERNTFSLLYASITSVVAFADVRVLLSPRDLVFGDLRLTQASIDSASSQPYVPGIMASASYERIWTPELSSMFTMIYRGQQWVDIARSREIDGYIDLRFTATYALSPSLGISLRGENILGSTVYVWDGYRERGGFLSLGLTWKFQ